MIDRRALLRLAAGAGTASLVAACGWDGGNAVRPLLLDVSRFNDWVGEKVFFSKNRLAPEYPIAQRTARVPVSRVAERCGMLPQARYVRFDSFDSGYSNGWDLASAMHPQTILAYGMNDNPLPATHGAPLRLYSPTKLGYKMTKYLVSLTFTDRRPGGYWEDQGYPWFAGI